MTAVIEIQKHELIEQDRGRDYSDVVRMLLESKRSENTRRGYRKDLEKFFREMHVTGREMCPETVNEFLSLPRAQAVSVVLQYKADLIHKGLAEATINRRLAAIKSLVNFARKVDRCSWDLSDIEGEKVESYRDVSGASVAQVANMLQIPDQGTAKGKRDYAIMRLLWENALRRNELVSCNIKDFDQESRTLSITGKGRGSQKDIISLSEKTAEAVNEWLQARGETDQEKPLFISLSNNQRGHRMTGTAVYNLIDTIARQAGIDKQFSPHRIRHSAITAALEALNGDVTKVQQLSRHKSIQTVMIYNDRRKNEQGEVTNVLSALA